MRTRVVVVALLVVASFTAQGGTRPAARAAPRPNIIVVMTDDQTGEQMRFLPRTRALIGGTNGTTFTNSYVNFPLCCPSRATFLTGQYMHNHGVDGNGPPPNGGYGDLNHANTLPVWLRASGYATAHIGKYLNGYGTHDPHDRPAGWTEWYGGIDFSFLRTYDYRMNRNGAIKTYGHTAADYQTDVLANDAVRFINRRAPSSQPFFLSVAPLAVHRESKPDGSAGSIPIQPAPRDKGTFSTLALPKPPNFNEADVSDKPTHIRILPRISKGAENAVILDEYRHQAEALRSVDRMVERIVGAVSARGELADTVIMFTSDNGYFHGEHRQLSGKTKVYEPVVRVPLLARGPGFARGRRASELVINADLAPTIVGLAHATPQRVMDGRSLFDRDPNRTILFETANTSGSYDAVRTRDWKWVEYDDGQRELYDLVNDPWELDNIAGTPPSASRQASLRARLAQLRTCAGATCRSP